MIVRALSSTGESLLAHMKTKEISHKLSVHINDVVSKIKTKWVELKEKEDFQWKAANEKGEKFEKVIEKLAEFSSWLNEFYSTVYEEFCEQIPPKSSNEIIAHHRTTLRVGCVHVVLTLRDLWNRVNCSKYL